MNISPVFILGCPRSGTTLLSELLSPTTYGSPVETHFIPKYFKKLDHYGNIEQKDNFTRLIKDILSERPVMQWKLDIDIEKFHSELDVCEYSEIVHKLCMMYFEHKGKTSWGDKTPHYILDSDIIYRLFPDAKYLYIVRDGRDVALSLLKKLWGPNNVYACAEYWKQCNAETDTLALMRKHDRVFELTYEGLLDQPSKVVEKIYMFLGEPYSEESVKSLIEKINRINFNKWKKEMKPDEVRLFETMASNTLKRFGYEATFEESELKKIEKWFWKAHNDFFRYKHLIKMNTVDAIRIKYFGMEPFAD